MNKKHKRGTSCLKAHIEKSRKCILALNICILTIYIYKYMYMCIFYVSMYMQNIYHEIQLFCFFPPNVIYTGIHL